MKKLYTLLAAALVCCSLGAQNSFGIIGGLSFSHAPKVSELKNLDFKSAALYHLGLTYQHKSNSSGFAIQPSLLFEMKGCDQGVEKYVRQGAVKAQLGLQWGPDLLIFRPYIEVLPYIGANVFTKAGGNVKINKPQVFMGGVGLGGGIEIWHFQISAHYNWDFNAFAKNVTDPTAAPATKAPAINKPQTQSAPDGKWAFRSTTLSLAILF